MNKEQIAAAFKLLRLMDGDQIAQADANSYNEWHRSLSDHLVDVMTDEIKENGTSVAEYVKELSKL